MGETYSEFGGYVKNSITREVKQHVSSYAPTLEPEPDDSELPPRARQNANPNPNLLTSMVAGASAGVVVDISLFPLDTLKTRLQSKDGFKASGGFRNVYKGIVPVLIGSAPISALFFMTYNTIVNQLKKDNNKWEPTTHVIAASMAEVVGASIRVPLEIIKQRKQISAKATSLDIIKRTLTTEGIFGMYRGFVSTITREVPFAVIQFPTWEFLKHKLSDRKNGQDLTALQTACCGAIAGGLAATMTTPMDVIKTRIMLAEKDAIEKYGRLLSYHIAMDILHDRGIFGFFAGVVPRVLWITLGGFIYFGVYEKIKNLCEKSEITLSKRDLRLKQLEDREKRNDKMRGETEISPSCVDTETEDHKFTEAKNWKINSKLKTSLSNSKSSENGKIFDRNWKINDDNCKETEIPKS